MLTKLQKQLNANFRDLIEDVLEHNGINSDQDDILVDLYNALSLDQRLYTSAEYQTVLKIKHTTARNENNV